jgi:hypothetical protein
MKNLYLFLLIAILSLGSCSSSGVDASCGTYNGKTLYKGPNGGCYYNNSNGNKTYVDRSYCKC